MNNEMKAVLDTQAEEQKAQKLNWKAREVAEGKQQNDNEKE